MGNLDNGDNFPLYQEAARRGYCQETAIYYMWDYFADDPDFIIPETHRDKSSQIFAAGLKLIGDGSVSGRTAWMDKPYLGTTDEYGISTCSDSLMESAVAFCKKYHCQLSMHAMGGSAISRVVDRAYREENWMEDDTPYVRVEHITDPAADSIRKAAEKGMFFVTQRFLCTRRSKLSHQSGRSVDENVLSGPDHAGSGSAALFFHGCSGHILGSTVRPVPVPESSGDTAGL